MHRKNPPFRRGKHSVRLYADRIEAGRCPTPQGIEGGRPRSAFQRGTSLPLKNPLLSGGAGTKREEWIDIEKRTIQHPNDTTGKGVDSRKGETGGAYGLGIYD